MAVYEINQVRKENAGNSDAIQKIRSIEERKTAQYAGEGSIFFLLILAGAVFIFRAVRRQFKSSQQQQHFMMAVTHELKTPIAVTKLNLETLLKRKLGEDQQERLLQNTVQEANRLNALCNNMLLASQIETGGYQVIKEEVNLTELVSESAGDFTTRFPYRTIRSTVNKDVFVLGDKLLLQMAINNLVDNAIKYSPKESVVTITLQQQDQLARLSVLDEGKGIDTSEKKKVFDKFYRIGNSATRGAKGTGLGLYLTKKIMRQHNGQIFVTDNSPTGTNFTIELKAAATVIR